MVIIIKELFVNNLIIYRVRGIITNNTNTRDNSFNKLKNEATTINILI